MYKILFNCLVFHFEKIYDFNYWFSLKYYIFISYENTIIFIFRKKKMLLKNEINCQIYINSLKVKHEFLYYKS